MIFIQQEVIFLVLSSKLSIWNYRNLELTDKTIYTYY